MTRLQINRAQERNFKIRNAVTGGIGAHKCMVPDDFIGQSISNNERRFPDKYQTLEPGCLTIHVDIRQIKHIFARHNISFRAS